MNGATVSQTRKRSVASLIAACAILAVVLGISGCAFGWFAYRRAGETGIAAAAIATGICLLAGCLALLATFVGQRFGYALQTIMAATGIRLGLPLTAGLILQSLGGPLVEAGLFQMIMGSYLLMLLVETLLSLKFISANSTTMAKAA